MSNQVAIMPAHEMILAQKFIKTFDPISQPYSWMQGYRDAEDGIAHDGQSGDYLRGYSAYKQLEANREARS